MLRHAFFLILYLLAGSITATASAHGWEGFSAAACDGDVHIEGNLDPVVTDGDQSTPHHHATCHGHSVTAPTTSLSLRPISAVREALDASAVARMATRLIGPALEPPRA